METMELAEVRYRLQKGGIKFAELAREAGIKKPNITAILKGRQYYGEGRRTRLLEALDRLERGRAEPETLFETTLTNGRKWAVRKL
jgi:transcriptional regulator with XRE-family HTH domain